MNTSAKRMLQLVVPLIVLGVLIAAWNNKRALQRMDALVDEFTAELDSKAFDQAEAKLERVRRLAMAGPKAKQRKADLLLNLGDLLDSEHDKYYTKLGDELITEAEEYASWYQFDQAERVMEEQLQQIAFRKPESEQDFKGRIAYLEDRIVGFRARKAKIQPEAVAPPVASPEFLDLWKRIRPRLNKANELLVKKESVPESALLRTDQKDLTKDINKILDQIGEQVFEGSPLTEIKTRYRGAQETIAKKRDRISAIREKIQEAPEEALFAKTREELEAEIVKLEGEIEELNNGLPDISAEMRTYLENLGMELTEEQVSIFFNRVDADELLGLMSIFQVLRPMHDQLAHLIRDNQDNLDYARKYYGMHMSLLQMIQRFQTEYINRIDEVHLPALMNLNGEAEATLNEAKTNLDLEGGTDRKEGYEANIKSLELTMQSVDLYKDVLIRQQKTVELARRKITRDLALAENTYKTVKLSSNLLDLINETQTTFLALSSLQLPEIVVFENTALQKKIIELSESLSE